ncbi:RNA polymerase sigma factor [Candidatus Fermentibacteria bacterium]|nr:RNA polymerase sigma factor [Candidatus Fermentibacteria bacterium]
MAESNGRSDEQLVEAANRGDPRAFDALYQRHKAWAAQLSYRFTGNHDDAMDVMQEAFIYLLRKFPGFRLTAAFTTFLYPVIKNIALSRLRKTRRIVLDENIVLYAGEPPKESGAERSLADIVTTLPAIHREVLLMRFVDDMKLEDIAEALAVPLGTVKSRLHNALKALREDESTRSYFEELQ